jgi:hypothetical protein
MVGVRGGYLNWTKGMTNYLIRLWPKQSAKYIASALSKRYGKIITHPSVSGKAAYLGLRRKSEIGRPRKVR